MRNLILFGIFLIFMSCTTDDETILEIEEEKEEYSPLWTV